MAVTATDRMGVGESHFTVNQPTELRPALPNHVTAGDRFEAQFTVLNRTDAARQLTVSLRATGAVEPTDGLSTSILATPYQRYVVRLPLTTTRPGRITLQARAGDAHDQDGLETVLTVRQRRALDVAATHGTTTAETVTEQIAIPADIRTDTGRLSVVVSPSVIGGVEGAFAYMRDYPYLCWEPKTDQRGHGSSLSQLAGVFTVQLNLARQRHLTRAHLGAGPANHQAANGGMAYYTPQDEYVSPYLSAYTALAFNWLRDSGYAIPAQVEGPLHRYLSTFLRRNTMPSFYTAGMSSTVRAVALAALAPHAELKRHDVQRYQRHIPNMSLFGKAHYLLALSQFSGTADAQTEVKRIIRAHANETSGKVVFSEAIDSGYSRILSSPRRSNCAILSAFLASRTDDAHTAEDLPLKLTRAITQSRQHRNRWENTQENMFCLQALIDFSRVYETESPKMTLRAVLGDTAIGDTTFQDVNDTAVELQRPIQPTDPGRTATLTLKREGQGRLYYATRLFYSSNNPNPAPINAGLTVRREYSVEREGTWMVLNTPMSIVQGELIRVDLYISLPAARNFVVVHDPVPGGLEPVNRELGTTSTVDADKAEIQYAHNAYWLQHDDWQGFGGSRWRFYHQELRHHAVQFYSEYLPAGRYHLSYTAQAIAPGTFAALPLRAEEMYDPETFGQGGPEVLTITATSR